MLSIVGTSVSFVSILLLGLFKFSEMFIWIGTKEPLHDRIARIIYNVLRTIAMIQIFFAGKWSYLFLYIAFVSFTDLLALKFVFTPETLKWFNEKTFALKYAMYCLTEIATLIYFYICFQTIQNVIK